MKKLLLNLEQNILLALSLIMIWGALVYYLFNLSLIGVSLTLILSVASFYLYKRFLKRKTEEIEAPATASQQKWPHAWWPIAIYVVLISSCFLVLIKGISSGALISPWLVVSKNFFWLYMAATAWLFYVLNQALKPSLKLWLLRIHYFLAFSVAAIVYAIGYGFDPFIHQATMELIDKQGYVLPKPPYYLGQYSLIIILHKLTGISIYLLNKFLVPLLAALLLPGALFSFLKNHGAPRRAGITILALLALPLNLFILSTPQNLAYLWLILLILYSFSKHLSYLPIILGLATLSIHPLGGLPAVFFAIWIEILKRKDQFKLIQWRIINIILWWLTALSLPLSFTLVTGQSWQDLALKFPTFLSLSNSSSTNIANFVLNLSYLVARNWIFVFIIFLAAGLIIWIKKNKGEALLLISMLSSLIFGFLLSASLSFNFLIDYERNDYISRLLVLTGLFVLPMVIIALNSLVTKVWRAGKTEIITGWLIASILTTASIYLSYPRLDAYTNSRGYNVSQSDILAVNSIAEQTKNPYIVLANQQTSVASLKELGFDHYFSTPSGPIFFYPIPTGGKLYQYYLDMVNKNPERKTMDEAMDLVGVKESYFAVSKYWWLSNRVIAEAKLQADKYWEINGGEIYIFKFIR